MLSLLVSNLYWMRWRTVHCTLYSFQWAVYTWGIYWRYLEKGKPCQKLKLDSNLYDKQGIRKISSSLKTRRLFVVTWFPWGWELPLSPHPGQLFIINSQPPPHQHSGVSSLPHCMIRDKQHETISEHSTLVLSTRLVSHKSTQKHSQQFIVRTITTDKQKLWIFSLAPNNLVKLIISWIAPLLNEIKAIIK